MTGNLIYINANPAELVDNDIHTLYNLRMLQRPCQYQINQIIRHILMVLLRFDL